MKKFVYHIEHTYGDDQNVWTSAENEYEAEQNIRHDYHSIKSLTLRRVEDMGLENKDKVIETDNEEKFVYVTKTGSVYHTGEECPSLKARKPELFRIPLSDVKKRGFKACKRCQRN